MREGRALQLCITSGKPITAGRFRGPRGALLPHSGGLVTSVCCIPCLCSKPSSTRAGCSLKELDAGTHALLPTIWLVGHAVRIQHASCWFRRKNVPPSVKYIRQLPLHPYRPPVHLLSSSEHAALCRGCWGRPATGQLRASPEAPLPTHRLKAPSLCSCLIRGMVSITQLTYSY